MQVKIWEICERNLLEDIPETRKQINDINTTTMEIYYQTISNPSFHLQINVDFQNCSQSAFQTVMTI